MTTNEEQLTTISDRNTVTIVVCISLHVVILGDVLVLKMQCTDPRALGHLGLTSLLPYANDPGTYFCGVYG